jgi:hypothetical protein
METNWRVKMEPSTDPVALAWAAGLFCGEGSIGLVRSWKPCKTAYHLYLKLQLGMCDKGSVEKFSLSVGVPIHQHTIKSGKMFYKAAGTGETALRAMMLMAPYMLHTDKYEQFSRALDVYNSERQYKTGRRLSNVRPDSNNGVFNFL